MDKNNRLQQILMLALRSETPEGESVAALNAARRLVAKNGIEGLFSTNYTVSEPKIKYKEKIIYRYVPHYISREYKTDLVISTATSGYLHALIEKIFSLAEKHRVWVYVKSCDSYDGNSLDGLKIKVTLIGNEHDIDMYRETLNMMVDRANLFGGKDKKIRMKFSTKKGLWRRLFDWL